MATAISGAVRLPDVDYSVPHRTPPQLPTIDPLHPTSVAPTPHPNLAVAANRAGYESAPDNRNKHSLAEATNRERTPRRQSSFSAFLRRSSSRPSLRRPSGEITSNEDQAAPPLPTSRISQTHTDGAHSPPSGGVPAPGFGRKMLRKSSALRKERELERQAQEAEREARRNQPAPQLPLPASTAPLHDYDGRDVNLPQSTSHPNFSRPGNAFAGNTNNLSMAASSSPAYAVRSGKAFAASSSSPAPATLPQDENVPVMSRPRQSMANRPRYSYASSVGGIDVNSPRRSRRRKDPTPFNILVVGAKNSGKSSFISFLRQSFALSSSSTSADPNMPPVLPQSSFTSHYLETELDSERIGLTLWDSAGLEKHIIDLQLREMTSFVESKFEETFLEEQKVMRSPSARDTHIHCVLLMLDPIRLDTSVAASQKGQRNLTHANGLDEELDLQTLRALWGKATIIPIVAKADTLTTGHMVFLKRAVWRSMKSAGFDPLEPLELDDDTDDVTEEDDDDDGEEAEDGETLEHNEAGTGRVPTDADHDLQETSTAKPANTDDLSYLPMSVLSPDPYDLPPYTDPVTTKSTPLGRRYPWGVADPYNPDHCDFQRLRDTVFSEWRADLRDIASTKWYETWRTTRLENLPHGRQRQHRVKGGVTPVSAVPRESRSSPKALRTTANGSTAATSKPGSSAIPRTVSDAISTAQLASATMPHGVGHVDPPQHTADGTAASAQ